MHVNMLKNIKSIKKTIFFLVFYQQNDVIEM